MSGFTNPYNGQTGYNPNRQAMQQQYMQGPQQSMFDQQSNWKPYYPEPKLPPLLGKWVSSFDDIKPMDVPMDGSVCFFPQSDGTCIYAMKWANDGTITPYRFLPEMIETQTEPSKESSQEMGQFVSSFETAMGALANRLDGLHSRLNDIYDKVSSPTKPITKTKNNKDGETT